MSTRRHGRSMAVGAVVGTVLAVVTAAIAAIILTSTLDGHVGASTKSASDELLAPSTSESGGVECNATLENKNKVAVEATHYTIKGENDGTLGQAGDCTVKLRLRNTGEVPLYIKGFHPSGSLPSGWTVKNVQFPQVGSSIAPGHSVSGTFTLHAAADADSAGSFSGTVETGPQQ